MALVGNSWQISWHVPRLALAVDLAHLDRDFFAAASVARRGSWCNVARAGGSLALLAIANIHLFIFPIEATSAAIAGL